MSRKHIDEENLVVTGQHHQSQPSGVAVENDAIVIVTQAFGPKGDNLVGFSDVQFDGHPAVSIKVVTPDQEGLVHLSPIHGDRRKAGLEGIKVGTKCKLYCPASGEPPPKIGEEEGSSGAEYFALYLTARPHAGASVAISDVWGHYHSRIVADDVLISYWTANHPEL